MNLRLLACLLVFLLSGLVTSEPAPRDQLQANKTGEPLKATVCELKNDPAAYNHKIVEITGFVSHAFEHFGISDPACSSWPDIWLEYGGTTGSNTMYCCGVTPSQKRTKSVVVENISIDLVADNQFKAFDTILSREYDTVVRATVVGRFFSGKKDAFARGERYAGYGHMGCCSLLAIQQVVSVDPHASRTLDYRATPDQPDYLDKTGCGYSYLTGLDLTPEIMKAQEKADSGTDDWVFSDPQRVAANGLARLLTIDESSMKFSLIRQAPGRMIYKWQPTKKGDSYMVVVSRPYLLSFYAKDPSRVAWVMVAAYQVGCGKDKAIRRIN
jgi:hypothetical protein